MRTHERNDKDPYGNFATIAVKNFKLLKNIERYKSIDANKDLDKNSRFSIKSANVDFPGIRGVSNTSEKESRFMSTTVP